MPQKINMFLSNGNPSVVQILAKNNASIASVPAQKTTSLSGPIIARIHNIKPGCGGCGRK